MSSSELESRKRWGFGDIQFQLDDQALNEFFALLARQNWKVEDKVTVTFQGLFETVDLNSRVVRRAGGTAVFGFGHLALSPGQLVIQSVSLRDVVVERRQSGTKN